MANEDRRKLFNAISKAGYDIGNYDDFDRRMNNAEDRKKFFTAVNDAGYDIGDQEEFEKRIGPSKYKLNIKGNEVPVSEREYMDFVRRNPSGSTKKPSTLPQQSSQPSSKVPMQLDLQQAQRMAAGQGPVSWEEPKEPKEETITDKVKRIFGGGATPEETKRIQRNVGQRMDEAVYEQETGKRLRQQVLNPEFEAPTIGRDEFGNVRRDENGNIIQGFTTDEGAAQTHQQIVGDQEYYDSLSDEEKREWKKRINEDIEQLDYKQPTMFESLYKGIGSGVMKAGIGLLEAMRQLSSGMIVEDASSPTGYTQIKDYDPNDTETAIGRGLTSANEYADSMSRQAQPNNGEGFVDMLLNGDIKGVVQKGLATAGESLPMTLSWANPYTATLNAISMAGNNFREQTLDNPDIPTWKRAAMAIGSAAIEQAVEKYADPFFKYTGGLRFFKKAGAEATEEVVKSVTEKATESLAKRIMHRLGGLAKDAAGEGAEEIFSNVGNDLLGEALDLLDGDKDYGIRAQWEQLKKQNPNADLSDFAYQKAKENIESFIGGALAGFYTSGTTQVSAKALEYSVGKLISQEEIAQNPDAQIDPMTMEVASSYDDGYNNSQDPNLRKQLNDEAAAAAEVLPNYGDEFAKIVTESENPVETLDYLMNNRDYFTDEQIEVAADYFQKKAAADGMMDGILDQVDTQVEEAKADVVSHTHQQTNSVITAQYDGREYFVVGGDVVMDPESGTPMLAGTGGAVVVKDSETGETSVMNPNDLTMGTMQSADELIQGIDTDYRQQLMQQAEDDISYGAPANEVYQIEDTVTLADGEGGVIEGQIGMMPNSVDGVYVVYTPDGRALQMTADDMNRRIVAHNGMEVQRESPQPVVQENLTTEPAEQPIEQNQPAVEQNQVNLEQNQPETEQEEPQSALSRIPVKVDEKGNPFTNKKGKPILDWHKASVEDAAAALVETTGGNMIMARDTASDLIKQGQAKLEKIRKQQPKGEDPIEIAESRMEIQRQVEEQQAINKQWSDVNALIQRQMREEQQRKEAERQAALTEEQRAAEAAEKARIEEQRRKIDEERRRKKMEEELANWNKPYAPLAKARKEMAGDPDAAAILDDVEPRSLEEWVSSLLQPKSMMWDDEEVGGRTVTGLQSELGLQKKDVERIGSLVGKAKDGAKPFGQVVHDIWEELPEGMKNMYNDHDVRNTLIGMFNTVGNALDMRHLAELNRIEEARDMMEENQRRDEEAEMEAWAEAMHLTPEERESFNEYMAQAPSEPETEIINNIIYDEQNRISETEGRQLVGRGNAPSTTGSQEEVQQEAETAGNGDNEERPATGAEATQNQQTPANDNVPESEGVIPTQPVDYKRLKVIRNKLTDAYSAAIDTQEPDAIKAVETAAKALRDYVDDGLNDYQTYEFGIEDYKGDDPAKLTEQYITRVYQDRYLDDDADQDYIRTGLKPEMRKRYAGAKVGNKQFEFNEYGVCTNSNKIENWGPKRIGYEILTALTEKGWVGAFNVNGSTWGGGAFPSNGYNTKFFATEEECQAYWAERALAYIKQHNEPKMKKYEVALQAIIDKANNEKEFKWDQYGAILNPNKVEFEKGNYSYRILTAKLNGKWVGAMQVTNGPKYSDGGTIHNDQTTFFDTEQQAQAHYAQLIADRFRERENKLTGDLAKVLQSLDEIIKQGGGVQQNETPKENPEQKFVQDLKKLIDDYDTGNNGYLTDRDLIEQARSLMDDLPSGSAIAKQLDNAFEEYDEMQDAYYNENGQRDDDGSDTMIDTLRSIAETKPAKVEKKAEAAAEEDESSAKAPNGQLFHYDDKGVCINPNPLQIAGNTFNVNMLTAFNGKGWVGYVEAKPRFDYKRGDVTKDATPVFQTEEECRTYLAGKAIDILKETYDGKQELQLIKALRKMMNQRVYETEKAEKPAKTQAVGEEPLVYKTKKGNVAFTIYKHGVKNIAVQHENLISSKEDTYEGTSKLYNELNKLGEWHEHLKAPGTKEKRDYSWVIPVSDLDKVKALIENYISTIAEKGNFENHETSEVTSEVNVEGLFNDLYTKGKAKLSDHSTPIKPKVKKRQPKDADFSGLNVGVRFQTPDGVIEIARVDYDRLLVRDVDKDGNASQQTREMDTVDLADGIKAGTITKVEPAAKPVVEEEVLVSAGTIMKNNIAGGNAVVKIVGSRINKQTGKREYMVEYYSDEQAVKDRIAIGDAMISQKDMQQTLDSGNFSALETKAEQPKTEHKRLVSDDRMEELKKQLKAKLGGQLNVGVDPEVLSLGAQLAVGYLERGVTKFADFAKAMIEEVGDFMRPYLKSFYNAVRDMPEAADYAGEMDDYQTVSAFDVHNFDKGGKVPDPITKAQQVVNEQKVKKDVKKIKAKQPDLFAGDLFADQFAEPIGKTSSTAERKAEEARVDTNPTEAQKEAGNYQKGHIWVDGHDVTIENPKGSIRRGTDANGKAWEIKMNNTYGYIRGTEGVDGDHIDVFLSDNPAWGGVFVVDQVKPDGSFDEHKVMYGFPNEEEARKAYLSNYSKGWKGLGTITEVSREDFKKWIQSSHRKTKPFVEYKIANNSWILATRGEDGTLMRRAIDSDLDKNNVQFYYNGKPIHIVAVTREGEQVSATQFSKPKVTSVHLTNGKSVKFDDVWVKVNPIVELNKTYKDNHTENGRIEFVNVRTHAKTGEVQYIDRIWLSGSATRMETAIDEKYLQDNLDKGIYTKIPEFDKNDYKTYMTPEAREYFAQDPRFTGWSHPELAFITAAVWDGVEIPSEELKKVPEIIEAEKVIKSTTANGILEISDEERDKHAQHLLDAEHGSAVFENGKIRKVNGVEDFTGPVRQERKALVIIGLPAGGKSSVFANPLSNQYGARIIDSDVVKPWLKGFDGGNGAGYVQEASSEVAERALDIAVGRGDNIIIPRIGGGSVVTLSAALKLAGYDVQLYFNDVKTTTSVNRAASRFAETGRYLSLDYLTSKDGVPSKNFSKFAEKTIGDYLNECSEGEVQKLRRRLTRLLGAETIDGKRLWQSSTTNGEGFGTLDEYVSALLEPGESNRDPRYGDLIYSYSEWKSNDVAFGEKPKEIWNSNSKKPLSDLNSNNNELHGVQSKQRLPRESGAASEEAGQASGSADRAGAERSPEQHRAKRSGSERTIKNNNTRNNVGERGKDYAPSSIKARFNANVEAIKLMRQLVDEDVENPTQEQKAVLRQYSGWGGMGTYFNDATTAEYRELMDLLSEEEMNDARLSINSAYYTPATVIDTLWDIAKEMGFKGGNVLEGSAGIGNIIGQMPTDMSRNSDIEAVEIDSISGNILKLLYPDAKVHIQGFQDTLIPNGSVDLAITNVPFVTGLQVFDKVDKDLSRKFRDLHDFCIAKNIRKLREGGIGLFITSSGTLDKSTELRAWIADEGQADVVGAFRMNNKTFGGTTVTSDIIVVRKRMNGQKSPNAIDISTASPIRVGSYEDKFGNEHQTSMVVNDYFKDHPEMMAGEMAFAYEKGDTFRPGSYGLYPVEGMDQDKMLADFAKSMSKAKEVVAEPIEQKAEPNQLTAVKEGRMLINDKGQLCVSRYGTAVPLQVNDQKIKGKYTKKECFEDYQTVQKAVDDVLQQQLNDPDDAALKPKLDALNKAYDTFVKKYGYLHKNTAIAFLRNDIDFPSFQALEDYRETKDIKGNVTVTTRKPPIFHERVLGFKTEPQPKNVKDAVTASIFRSNMIDLDWIADKLDKSVDDVRKEILDSRIGFEDPSTGTIEIRYKYLSGNVREKLSIAEGYNTDGKYAANVEELRKAVPMDIPSHLIDFSLGSSWLPVELYNEYIKQTYDVGVTVRLVEGSWIMNEPGYIRSEKNRAAGVYSEKFRETIFGHQLVNAALNNRPIRVSKVVKEGYGESATTKTVVDQAATQTCAVRVDEIKEDFRQWMKQKMQSDPDLAKRIEKIYNEKFNALVPMQIDDEFLPEHFEGSNVNITLRPHQKRGAIRDLTSPTMLAHEVGTGKSFTLITTAMEMRRLGTAKKPMLIVQNATVAQMTADAKLLYPNAKVLTLTEKDRNAEGRRAFYASIKYNDWDLIIIPQSTFERIPDSPERELQFIQEKIDEKKHVIEAAEAAGADSRQLRQLKKELEKIEQEYGDKFLDSDPANDSGKKKKKDAKREAASLEKAKAKAQEQLDRAVDDVQYFDDLGVDALLVDEAHEYKHLGFQTSIGRGIKGIDPSYSKKCAGLYNKTRCVYEKAGWKNVVFATGTPISNTAAEIWTFMKYLMPADVMKQNDIYYFDDFVRNFGNISQMLEFTTSGKFKENTRFAAYVNRPELMRIWMQVADIVRSIDAKDVQDKLPKKEGGKDQDVFLPQSPSLINIMAAVRAELERFDKMEGKEKKANSHIPLTMYGVAKRAAIDPRLINPDAPDEPLSKTNAAVAEILKDLKATKSYKGTVAVFCDNQNRKGAGGVIEFNIYDDIKQKLIKAGVPEKQIAIIKSGMTIKAKQAVFDAVNAGEIRVVLGSTQTLGTGVNMQERLHLLIHMDAPDRPMDYTQRNGRIERQGNLHKEWDKPIRIVRFGVEDSLDVTAYQRLKTKSGFIDSIMNGKSALANNQVDRTVEEEEEGVFDNPVAVLSGSQYALLKNKAERELRKYQGKKAQWEADQIYVTNALRKYEAFNEEAKENIKREESDLENIKNLFPDGKVKTITIDGTDVDMTKGNEAVGELSKLIKEKINDPANAVAKEEREHPTDREKTLHYTIKLDGHDVDFYIGIFSNNEWDNASGKMRTVVHKTTRYNSPELRIGNDTSFKSVKDLLDDILDEVITGVDYQDRIDAMKASIERRESEMAQMREREGKPFEYDKELEAARKQVDEYTELMKKEMEEKEAKYASQQTGDVDLAKAEDSEDDDNLYRMMDEYEEPIFYSNAMRAVEEIRQEKATPEQWLSMIQKNGGLKVAEDKWLGLSDWLNNIDKKSVTKQEILDFIEQNQIDVEEVHYGDEIVRTIDALEKRFPGYSQAFEIQRDLDDGFDVVIKDAKKAAELYNSDKDNDIKVEPEYRDGKYYLRMEDSNYVWDWAYDQAVGTAPSKDIKSSHPKRGEYTTMGLNDNREIALVVPSIESWNKDDRIHFGDAGEGRAVAWIRFGETTDAAGNRVLVIDEIQSKRHQDAKKKGYMKKAPTDAPEYIKNKAATKAYYDYLESLRKKYGRDDVSYGVTDEEEAEKSRLSKEAFHTRVDYNLYLQENKLEQFSDSTIPDAPFERNWHELAMKRMLRYAAENGYDKVAWTTGDQQVERYNIGKVIDSIERTRTFDNGETRYDIFPIHRDAFSVFVKDGVVTRSAQEELEGKSLADVVGKELALKMLDMKDEESLDNINLRVGGEGMRGFYDDILPRFMNKYGKKWGVSVKDLSIPKLEGTGLTMHSVDVTPEMRESVMQGQAMFRDMDQFAEGQLFPIRKTAAHSSYNVLGQRYTYSTELLPDEYTSENAMLDALRNQFPSYYVTIEDDNVKMQSWHTVLAEAKQAQTMKQTKGAESYVERKTRQAIDAVNDMAKRMHLDVEVLTSTEGLTEKQKRAKGWFNPKTHKIVIVLDNHTNRFDLINTLLHEGVAHYGLRKMFGENFETFLDNVYNNVDDSIREKIDAAMKKNGWSRHTATEEYLARLAERTDFENAQKSGWWQKIKDFFYEMLAKAGFSTYLTDNELRYILWRSYDNLLHPDSRRNVFDKAREVQMQSRLRIGNHAETIPIRRTASAQVAEPMMVSEPEYDEITQIINKAQADGTYMKAPNGKPTNLDEDQWAMVRTKAFKDWFGDWENDPENASKVVDENGEPKVMYHGTNLTENNGSVAFWKFRPDSHFGTEGQADSRLLVDTWLPALAESLPNKPRTLKRIKKYEVFLNIRNPKRVKDTPKEWIDEDEGTFSEWWDKQNDRAKYQGYDGIVYLNEYEDKENPADSWITFKPNQVKSATDNNGDFSTENDDIRYSMRTKSAPKKTGTGYKVFVLKDGKLYPPMVANPNGEGTPIGMWLDADSAPIAGTSKTGRPQVKAGGKGTQGGSGQLAYRPGWHLGTIPYALQFNRKDENGEKTLFPNNFVWAEVEYADDVDYNDEAYRAGVNENGKYQHSLAGLKHVPTDGSYMYRTNPNPETDPWIITGAMKVKKILSREEVDELVRQAGREPQKVQEGDVLDKQTLDELNAEIRMNEAADEMGLLYRSMSDDAQDIYNEEVAKKSLRFAEAWQDSMIGLKAIQDAIAAETGNVATGAEDAYHFENRMHGRAKNMTEQYDWRFYRPMLKIFSDFCNKHHLTQEQGIEYLVAKSGLERNVFYSFRNAMKKKVAEDLQAEREKLEKDYAKGKIAEATYKQMKADLQEKERTGVDDEMQKVKELLVYKRALEDYQNGDIDYSEYLRRIEKVINANTSGYYEEAARDFSGLTETFAKSQYDAAQEIKKEAQRAIDPKEKRELWGEYDSMMKDAYDWARQVAEDAVFAAEDNIADTNKLWNAINAATKETLKTSYENGLIDRKGYDKVRDMFDFYIPLRGWDENKAADVYTYMGKDNVFSPTVKKTWGRTSKAENPLAYIGNIAVSTILSGHRNMLKQHFLNYVMNNPTNLVSISESWYENIGTEDNPIWILRTADTAGKSADEIAQIVNDFNEEMQQKQAAGLAMPVKGRLRLDVNATKGQKSEHVVEVQRAGHTYQLYINGDPKAAQALNGTNAKAVSRISDTFLGRQMTKLNRAMAMFFTSKNPAFVVSNLSRDLNMAGASVAINEGKEYNARFIANAARVLTPRLAVGDFSREGIKAVIGKGKGATGMMPKLMSKWMNGKLNENNEVERYFKEFMDEGGETGFVNMLSVDSFKEKMKKEIKEMNGSTLLGSSVKETSVGKALRLLGETFEFYNRCAEDATRFIVYMTSRQMGKTLEESIADAKDVTLNFNRKGTGDMGNAEVRDLFIFVNPAIQALANMYRMAKGHPLKFGAVTAAFVAGGAMMAILNTWALNMFGDDDDKEAYWNLPPWVRKNNLVIWVPGTKNFITIPLAQEFRVFYGVGEMLASASMDHPVHNPWLEVASSVADLIPINPTGNGGNLMVDFAPTMIQPLMQVGENVDFTGKPIWKDNQGNKYAPAYTKAYVSTPRYMVKVAEAINSFGGNEGKQGYIEQYSPIWGDYINNPAVWNHLLQGYFGGMYNTIAKGFDVITTAAQGEMPKIYQTPVINRFMNRPVERDNAGALGEEYYKLIEDRDRLKYELRIWRKKAADGEEGAKEHVDEILESPEWKQAEVIDHYDKIMKDLRAGEKAATGEDKANIKKSISMYKQQLDEELNAISEGQDPLDAATEQFNKAKTFAEKNKLRLRIERLTREREDADNNRSKSTESEVAKALSYIADEEADSRDVNQRYLQLATAQNIRDDARIKAAKSKLKKITDEGKRLEREGRAEEAIKYQSKHSREINASQTINSLTRTMNENKKLLGKGYDAQIMKLIDSNRRAILVQIERLE